MGVNMFSRNKRNGHIVPGDRKICKQCVHYMLGDYCQQDSTQREIDFSIVWKYMCSYFVMDTSKADKALKEHKDAAEELTSTVRDFNKLFKTEKESNVIPIIASQQ